MASPIAAWRRFLARPNGDRVKTLGIAFLVAFCAALLVSTASVLLKPRQQAHIEAARQAQLDRMLDTLPGLRDLMLEAGVDALLVCSQWDLAEECLRLLERAPDRLIEHGLRRMVALKEAYGRTRRPVAVAITCAIGANLSRISFGVAW